MSSPATKHSAVASTSSPWSANKSQQLAKFLLNWASQMGQHYESYYPGHDFNLYGVIFPTPPHERYHEPAPCSRCSCY
ncbi:DUF4767 domain-containing protein [Weissella cibaria]|uniref:DUF4767 domain-containing protein n=1 Tax=Weissella cibaria TaxID=137591 RepID=UPI0030020230